MFFLILQYEAKFDCVTVIICTYQRLGIFCHGGDMRACLTLTESQEPSIRSYIPPTGAVKGIADFYFIFSDSTRLKILSVLAVTELCVCDVCILLGLNQTTVSHQLKLLRDARIVADRRVGKIVFHRIVNPYVNEVMMTGVNNLNTANGKYV